MSIQSVLFPLFVEVVLTFVLGFWLSALRVDAIEVVWPDGTEESFSGCAADQIVVLRKGEGKPATGK